MDSEQYARHLQAIQQSSENALKAVNAMNLPKCIVITNDSFNGLGRKNRLDAVILLKRLSEAYQQYLPYLMGVAVREHWFSLHASAEYIRLNIAAGDMGDNDYTKILASPIGYGESEGVAYTLYNHLVDLKESKEQVTFRDNTPFQLRLNCENILDAAALNWFGLASSLFVAGETTAALDWISEAYEAREMSHGNYMWNAGAKETKAEIEQSAGDEARSTLARIAAQARHGRNNPARNFVITEWSRTRTEYEGNKTAFTRDYVRRVLNEYGVQVTEKTMREVWLKDTPDAGKQAG